MSKYKIGNVTNSNVGDHGVVFVDTSVPQDVRAAFEALRQSAASSPDTRTEEELTSLESELSAESPSEERIERILSRIRVVTEAAGATGAIGKAADALSTAVHSWFQS